MKQTYVFLWLLLICQHLFAQKKGMVPIGNQLPAGTERRLALIVGNKDYQNPDAVLKNPINDAISMRNALQKLGFDVLYYNNLERVAFEKAIDDFGVKLNNYNVGLFYYSGHGIQAQGENYLVPIDANIIGTEAVVNYTCVNMGRVLGLMEGSKAETNLVFLDACRNNPFKKSWGNKGEIQRGLAIPRNPPGTCVVYATSAGATADDNVASTNGLFTENLLQYLSVPNMSLSSILNGTRKEVYKKSNKTQLPEDHVKLLGDFYFLVSSADKPNPTPELVKKEESAPVKPKADLLPYEPEMVFVRGGTFQMGSNEGANDEKPVHSVSVSDFWIGKKEVTVGEYLAFCDATKNHYPEWLEEWSSFYISTDSDNYYKKHGYNRNSTNLPIVGISWYDAVAYTAWLSKQTGKSYRLPTESEWEYAARGGGSSVGTLYAGTNDANTVAWNNSNSGSKVHKVATKKANELGLYDMSGNVWEWCSDWKGAYTASKQTNPKGANSGPERVMRGGSWNYSPQGNRVAFRISNPPDFRNDHIGFRVVYHSKSK